MNIFACLATRATAVLPLALLAAGLYFGVLLRFFPFLHPRRVWRALQKGGKTARRSTMLALAGTVGVGNIAGVALAISAGGPGALFWMWICAFAAMMLKYAEITLSMAHRTAGGGGTPYVMQAVGLPRLGRLFALLCLAYTLLVGGAVQANAVSECLLDGLSLSPLVSGLILIGLTLPVILGGASRISALTAKLVPLMCRLYVAASLAVIVANRTALPGAIMQVLREAFTPAAAAGGGLGFLSARALRVGAARGLMSNEGGCGTAPMAHAVSQEKSPARQGLFGIVEVFVDTTLLCTLTALALLTTLPALPAGVGGVSLVRLAFSTVFGRAAGSLLALLLFFFAYATVLCQAFYGRVCTESMTSARPAQALYSLAFCGALLAGALGTPALVWQACDILLAIMTLCNLFLLLRERKTILLLTKEEGFLD